MFNVGNGISVMETHNIAFIECRVRFKTMTR